MVRFDSGHFRLPVLFGSSLYVFRFGLVLCLICTWTQLLVQLLHVVTCTWTKFLPGDHYHLGLAFNDALMLDYQVFLSQGIGMGIGAGLIFLPTSAVITQHFVSNRALAMVRYPFKLKRSIYTHLVTGDSYVWRVVRRCNFLECAQSYLLLNLLPLTLFSIRISQ